MPHKPKYVIRVLVNNTPSRTGYNDYLTVETTEGVVLGSVMCRATPNHQRTKDSVHWSKAFGVLAPGTIPCGTIKHRKYGTCVLLNRGREVPARFPNPNVSMPHYGEKVVDEILIHKGYTNYNPGSAGCITVLPSMWSDFLKALPVGKGLTIVEDRATLNFGV